MWWKFWTWGRGDHQQMESDRRKSARDGQPNRGTSGSAESEDILGSISALIGDSPAQPMDSERKIRTVTSLESVQAIQTAQSFDTIDLEKIQSAESSQKPDPNSKPTTPAATEHSTMKAGDLPPTKQKETKQKEFRSKDSGQTLVADDGKWVAIRGMFDGTQNPNDTDDDDDATGPSPYQTIVPSDD